VNEGSEGGSSGLSTSVLATDGEPVSISQRGGRGCRLGGQGAVWRSRGAQDGEDEAGGGPAWADVAKVLGGGRHSLVKGEQCEGWRPISSERWLDWRADPQSMMTQRCTRR
jgi:hypothetical protein